MQSFRHVSLQKRVALMSALLILAFLLLGGAFAWSLNTLQRANELQGLTQQAMREASDFLNATLAMKTSLRDYLASGKPDQLRRYQDAQVQVFSHLQKLRAAVADPQLRLPMEAEAALHIAQMDNGFNAWKSRVADPFQRVPKPAPPLTLYRFLSSSEDHIKPLRLTVQQFQVRQQNLYEMRSLRARDAANAALKTAVLGSGLALLLVLLGFSMLARSMVDPLLQLTTNAQAIAAGDYSGRAADFGRTELGRLATAFNVMAASLETVRAEQSAIRSRLEALNHLAAHLSRSLFMRDRAEAVVLTLRKEFGATTAKVWLPELRRGWVCVESGPNVPVEYHLYTQLPDRYQALVASRNPEQRDFPDSREREWTTPLLRSDRVIGLLQIRFPMDQWAVTEPLLGSFSRFSSHAFELARVHEEVNAERHRLDAILNSLSEGVLVRDDQGRIVLANPAVFRILGIPPQPAQDLPLAQLLQEDEYADLLHFIEADPAGPDAEDSGAMPLGSRYLTATRVSIQDLDVIGAVIVLRDITQQVEVDRMKSEFISVVSHELRTPLTSIKGSLGLLIGGAGGELPAKMTQLLTIAQNNSDRLIRLINDILDISKIEAGRVQMAREPVDLAEVIRAAIEQVGAVARDARVSLHADLPPEPFIVTGDRDRLLQVVINLLSNAIKFSPPDGVVTAQARLANAQVTVSIADQGPGIPPDAQEKLFQKFYQVDSSSARAKSGTGLGLAISQAIVKEHNGLIGVESASGQGSRFWFTLPGSAPAPSPHPVVPLETDLADRAPGSRVLICDDDPDIATLIAYLLQSHGYQCERVHSGADALLRLKEERFDLLTLDLAMPGMNGLEVARRIEADPDLSDLPIVFVSAHSKTPEAQSLHVAGWVTKPIEETLFQDAIRRALRLRSSPDGDASAPPRILLVDDDPDVLHVLGEMVAHAGLTVGTAKNGQEALQAIRRSRPDAVVLDIMMPVMDGFDVMDALRRDDATRDIPILVLTAKDLTQEERKRLDKGDTRFLTKSYASQQAILDDLSQLLHGRVPTPPDPPSDTAPSGAGGPLNSA